MSFICFLEIIVNLGPFFRHSVFSHTLYPELFFGSYITITTYALIYI